MLSKWTVRFVFLRDISDDGLNEFILPFSLPYGSPAFLSLSEFFFDTLSSGGNFESESMMARKNHSHLGLYYILKF